MQSTARHILLQFSMPNTSGLSNTNAVSSQLYLRINQINDEVVRTGTGAWKLGLWLMVFPMTTIMRMKPQMPERTPRVIFMDEIPLVETTPITV